VVELNRGLAQVGITPLDSGCVEICIAGEIDLACVEGLRAAIQPTLENAPEHMEIDLEGVRFMDSSGIAVLLTIANTAGDVRIVRPSAPVLRIIELTGLASFLKVGDAKSASV
jgi:anti-sigma B factor antagonist